MLVDEAHAATPSERRRRRLEGVPGARASSTRICSVSASSRSAAPPTLWGTRTAAFTIMSVAKPFVFALVCEALGSDEVEGRVGVNATGLPFNAVEAVERVGRRADEPDGQPGRDRDDEPRRRAVAGRAVGALRDGLSGFAGRPAGARRGGATPRPRRPTTATASSRPRSPSATRSPAIRRGDRPLHPAELAGGHRARPRRDGRHARRRRRQPAHRARVSSARPPVAIRSR